MRPIDETEILEELKCIAGEKCVHKWRFLGNFNDNEQQFLLNAKFWLMDGTFDITPNLFSHQLYSIHGKVGWKNSVFVLMKIKKHWGNFEFHIEWLWKGHTKFNNEKFWSVFESTYTDLLRTQISVLSLKTKLLKWLKI